MASSRSTNTFGEVMNRMLGDLAQAQTLPDADLEFIGMLTTAIVGKLREPYDMINAQMQMGQEAMNTGVPSGTGMQMAGPNMPIPVPDPTMLGIGGGLAGGMPPDPTMMGAGMPPGVPGLNQTPQLPNADELRRVLSQAG